MRAAKRTLLWSFQNPEGYTSYVFGTMHVRDGQAFYLENEVIPYLESCANFAAELDLNQAGMEQASILQDPAPVKLSALLTQAQFKRLDRCCRKYLFLPATAFDDMYPMMLIQLFTARVLQTNRPVSLDQTLWNYADRAGKKCSGLETWEEQLADFHKISMQDQKRALLQVIRNFGKFRKQLLKLMKYYIDADLRSLYIYTKKSLGKSRNHLLYKRNERLADRMVTIGKESSLFAAVGAAHLWGKFGIIRLLKKKGFQVKPVAIQLSDHEHGDQEE